MKFVDHYRPSQSGEEKMLLFGVWFVPHLLFS